MTATYPIKDLAEQLEVEYGTQILEELTGQSLSRKGQSVRLFDQTAKSAEAYYPADEQGKPYIQNFKEGKRWYPINAWMLAYDLDWKAAVQQLTSRYLSDPSRPGKRSRTFPSRAVIVATQKPPASYHDPAFVLMTLADYERNNFAIYLRRLFSEPVADELLAKFRVGTWPGGVAREWQRCTVFWQIDCQDRVHAGKIMYYSPGGKRMKEKGHDFSQPAWAHSLIGVKAFHLEQCLFGEHQLRESEKPIALVESEKTAIVCTAFEPGFTWLACGGLSQLSVQKCKPLAGRPIVLFPDLGGLGLWQRKAEELRRGGYTVSVSTLLEHRASSLDRQAGSDLADFLTRDRCPATGRVLNEADYPALWDCQPLNSEPTLKLLSLAE